MLLVRKEAEEDIRQAYEWYEEKHKNLGIAFIDEIESKLIGIAEHPDSYTEVKSGVRRALCNRFPYAIYFQKNTDSIVVIAVLHQRRNPVLWHARKGVEPDG